VRAGNDRSDNFAADLRARPSAQSGEARHCAVTAVGHRRYVTVPRGQPCSTARPSHGSRSASGTVLRHALDDFEPPMGEETVTADPFSIDNLPLVRAYCPTHDLKIKEAQ